MIFDEIPAFATLLKIAKRLRELNIAYAVTGDLAMFFHGLERSTDVLELLVSRESQGEIHQRVTGLDFISSGYGSKDIRDKANDATVKFIVAGDFPGDGRRKPVVHPDPLEASVEKDGIRWMKLPVLIDIKLASGMTNPGRLKDLDDVRELIEALHLSADYAEQLNPYVREKFEELRRAGEKES
ncbi:MAG: hypothetical protein IT426_19360 [Pirellulales bacterium]|nr:hypothetical protein [Pirellulales bacterium]